MKAFKMDEHVTAAIRTISPRPIDVDAEDRHASDEDRGMPDDADHE